MNPGLVRRDGHGATERINLSDQVTLANTADGWITGHLTQGLDILGNQERRGARTS